MKKLIIIVLLISSIAGASQTIYTKDLSNYRYKFYELVIRGDSLNFTGSQVGQLLRFNGNKFTNWSPNFITAETNYNGDSTGIKSSIRALLADSSAIKSHVRNWSSANVTLSGNFSATKKVSAQDSLCLGKFHFIISGDTLCSVVGTDTLRIHPKRP